MRDDPPGLVDDLVGRPHDRLAADRQRARAVGVLAEGAGRGVAVHDLDLIRRDPEPVGDDLGEAGLVALAVRRRAGVGGHRAGRVDAHDRRLEVAALHAPDGRAEHARRRQAADLHVGGEAEAAVDATLAQLGLLAPERLHVHVREQLVERALVVAGVVDHPVHQLGREAVGGDEVLPPQLERVHAELRGELVHHRLDDVDALRPARAADRVGRELVREHAHDVALDVRDLVAAGDHAARERRDDRALDEVVAAAVLDDLRVDRGQRPVALGAQLGVGDVVAPVVRRGHVLGARGDPLDRPVQLARRVAGEDLLAVDLQLGPEAAAHLRRDHADAVLADAELDRQHDARDVRDLRRGVQREAIGLPGGEHPARLDRRARRAVVDDPPLHDHVGVRQARVDVAAADAPLEHAVGVVVVVHGRRRVLERRLRIDDDGQRVVLDDHLLGGVDHGVLVPADDRGDALADVADLAAGERPVVGHAHVDAGRLPEEHARRRHVGDVLAREHRLDVLALERGGGVDRHDAGVRLGGAHEGHVELAGHDHVVHVGGPAGDQARVLLALERLPDVAVAAGPGLVDDAHRYLPACGVALDGRRPRSARRRRPGPAPRRTAPP